jgi:RHS repeat-associated protein
VPAPFRFKAGYALPGGNIGETSIANRLYHFGSRYYDPTTGRWTQQDPLSQLTSVAQSDKFGFVGDTPPNASDPEGSRILPQYDEGSGNYCSYTGREWLYRHGAYVSLKDCLETEERNGEDEDFAEDSGLSEEPR